MHEIIDIATKIGENCVDVAEILCKYEAYELNTREFMEEAYDYLLLIEYPRSFLNDLNNTKICLLYFAGIEEEDSVLEMDDFDGNIFYAIYSEELLSEIKKTNANWMWIGEYIFIFGENKACNVR